MAQGDVHSLQLAGTYLGVPIAVTMAYQQEEVNPAVVTPGADLINSWFLNVVGPWDYIRPFVSDQLTWDCAVSQYGDKVDTIFLSGGTGLSAAASLPSTHCCQVNVPAVNPHPLAFEGRFYWPGFLVGNTYRSGWSGAFNVTLLAWASSLLALDGHSSGLSGAWRMVPHGKYLDANNGTDAVHAFLPYHDPFVKVLGTRKANSCAAFLGGGAGDFGPVIIPPPPP